MRKEETESYHWPRHRWMLVFHCVSWHCLRQLRHYSNHHHWFLRVIHRHRCSMLCFSSLTWLLSPVWPFSSSQCWFRRHHWIHHLHHGFARERKEVDVNPRRVELTFLPLMSVSVDMLLCLLEWSRRREDQWRFTELKSLSVVVWASRYFVR